MKKIEVVDESPLLWGALSIASERAGQEFAVARHSRSWLDFSAHRASAADIVIVSAELRDHVPVLLKVRAVKRMDTRVLVVLQCAKDQLLNRLLREGAAAVFPRGTSTVSDVLDYLHVDSSERVAGSDLLTPESLTPESLTDREVQIAALFASRASPTAQQIAELLGLSVGTVRAHLKLARRRLQAQGLDVSDRPLLRRSLLAEGYSVPEF